MKKRAGNECLDSIYDHVSANPMLLAKPGQCLKHEGTKEQKSESDTPQARAVHASCEFANKI